MPDQRISSSEPSSFLPSGEQRINRQSISEQEQRACATRPSDCRRLKKRPLACALMLLCLWLLTLPVAAQTPSQSIFPHVNCIIVDEFSNQVTALIGYDNRSSTNVIIPVGAFNTFVPSPQNRGQPSSFSPGRHDAVFAVTFHQSTEPIKWIVNGNLVEITSTNPNIARCVAPARRTRNDFDADERSEFVIWQPNSGTWLATDIVDESVRSKRLGNTGDIPVTGDYDGDRRTDFAVWRPTTGDWHVIKSTNGETLTRQWGAETDIPVPGDYDGDGKSDFAVWRPGEGNWYVIQSSNNTTTVKGWGAGSLGDVPVPGDYDGDKKTDMAVWRGAEGNWYILNSSNNTVRLRGWGASSLNDKPVPADYDGDGKTDIAVWRPSEGNWYIIHSWNNSIHTIGLGESTDVPAPADYDKDGKADPAVFRPTEGNAYIIRSSTNTVKVAAVGNGNLVP